MKDLVWTGVTMALFAWCAIVVSLVHTGEPFSVFQPPVWVMPLALLSWMGVSWLCARVIRHAFERT